MMNGENQFVALIPPGGDQSQEPVSDPEDQPVALSEAERPYITIGDDSVSYLGVEVPKGQGGRLVPNSAEFREEYFYLEGHHIIMREVATALILNKPILLEGGTGVYNKTTTIARMCRDLNMNYCKVNFDRETAREDVIGGQTLRVDENGRESLVWYDGDLMYAIRNGGVAFLDEYNRQGKLAGIINPIIDAILNGRKEISNPYNENERVRVHPDFRLVAAQNPPGMEEGHEYTDRSQLPAETFGRWIYHKLPIKYSEDEENKLLAGVIGEQVSLDLPTEEFRSAGEGIPVKELASVPGMTHWRREIVTIIRLLEAKSVGSKREMARGQRQNLYFNPRLTMGTIPQYIARFYNGDINETVRNALETCVIGMYSAEEDRQKIRNLLDQAAWQPPVETRRRGLDEIQDEAVENDLRSEADREIESLLVNPAIPDAVRAALSGTETVTSGEISVEDAKEIMTAGLTEDERRAGVTNFLGAEAIANSSFGSESVPAEIPPIPFSRTELEQAAGLGQFLILRTDQIHGDKMALPQTKQTLERPLTGRWALVTKEVLVSSTDKNYLEQTEEIVKYLQETVFADRSLPLVYAEAIAEFESVKEELRPLTESGDETIWKKAAIRLSDLKITQLIRRSRDEVLYDLELYKQTNNIYLLNNRWDWTASLSSGSRLVDVGGFDAVGAVVGWDRPVIRNDDLGVSVSRQS